MPRARVPHGHLSAAGAPQIASASADRLADQIAFGLELPAHHGAYPAVVVDHQQ
jgi:hypothetical protein